MLSQETNLTIHIASYATPSVARLAAHWLREVRAMEACERSGVRYELHMRRAPDLVLDANSSAPDRRRWGFRPDEHILASTQHSLSVVRKLAPTRALVLWAELDVQPLLPYSELLPFLGTRELVVMREPQPGVTPADLFNGGFYLLRATSRTRAWLRAWVHAFRHERLMPSPPVTNQPSMLRALRETNLQVGVFPRHVVTGRVYPWLRRWPAPWDPPFPKEPYLLRNTTVAFHAIAIAFDPTLFDRGAGPASQENKIITMLRAAQHVRAHERACASATLLRTAPTSAETTIV